MSFHKLGAIALSFLLVPAAAMAQPGAGHTFGQTFSDASLFMQILMILLIGSAIAAVALTVRKVMSGPHLTGGSAFLSALRLGGPLIGLLGAVYNAIFWFVALANTKEDVPIHVMAPGFIEALTLFLLGLMAGVVAVICHWIVEARIDRAVLRA